MECIATEPRTLRLQKLLRHVEGVQRDCRIIAVHLIERGDFDLGKQLIAHGMVHDASKFSGIEWDHLGSDDPVAHRAAWEQHVTLNKHHPEHWGQGGIHAMSPVYLAEMVCDWHSRSSEFDNSVREWMWETAMPRFGFTEADPVFGVIEGFMGLLLERRWS